MIWLSLLCSILLLLVILLGIKIFVMRKAIKEIYTELSDKLQTDTNTLISISSEDKLLCHLADYLNTQLKDLQKQKQRFLQGNLELKTAITNISHDLRTPLTAISSYLDLLDKVDKSKQAERYVGIIKNRTEALRQLTEELFQYSIITSPEYDMTMEFISLNRILEDSILEYYATLHNRKITPTIHITEETVVRNINSAALSRVFSNLLNNAIKYSNGDLDITLKNDGTIIFSNTAPKLNEVQVEKLFDRFYTLTDARKSTGLGLAIARTLIEQMNGTITANYENDILSV